MLAVFDLTEDQLPDDGQTLQWSCQAIRVFPRNRWCTLLGEKSKKNSVLHRSSHPISTLSTVIFRSNDLFVEMANSRSPSNFGVHMDHYESLLCRLPMFSWLSFLVPVPVHGHAWTSSTASLLKCWVSWHSRWDRESLHWVIFNWSLWGSGWNLSNRMANAWKRGHGATTHCAGRS